MSAIIYLTRQLRQIAETYPSRVNKKNNRLTFPQTGRLFFMSVKEALYKCDDCDDHKYKCKQVIICNIHIHHPFRKTPKRMDSPSSVALVNIWSTMSVSYLQPFGNERLDAHLSCTYALSLAYRNVSLLKEFVRINNGRIQIIPLYCTQNRKIA